MYQPSIPATYRLSTQQAVRLAFDELDWRQLAIFARHTPARRLQMMFEICEFIQGAIIASERQRAPHISDEELARRVRVHINLAYATKNLA